MMKLAGKFSILVLLAALLLLPFQTVYARGLADGPIFGSNYVLQSGDTLNQDLVVFGGSISIEKDARVNGAIVLFGGSLTLDGEVGRDVVVMGGAVKLGPEARVHGNLVAMGAPIDRDPLAKVDGDVVNNPTRPNAPVAPAAPLVPSVSNVIMSSNPLWSVANILGQSLMLALLAMLIAMFMPNQMRRVADGVVAQPFVAFGMGLLTLIVFIVTIVALALFSIFLITLLVTIPLIVIVSVLFAAGMVLGWMALGMEVGVRMGQVFNRDWPLPLAAGLGVFLLNLVGQGISFIPVIGGSIATLVAFAGLGAVFMTRFGVRPASLTIVPAAVVPTPPAENS